MTTDAKATAQMHSNTPPRSTSVGAQIDELPLNMRHWWVFAVCAFAFLIDSLDLQALGLAAPSIIREWGADAKSMGFVFSVTSVGMLIGSLTFGIAADRFGRRGMLQFAIALFSVFAAACAFSRDMGTLAILRFFVGLGVGGLIPITTAMVTECMPAKQRGRMISLWAIFLPLGNFVAAGSAALVLPGYGWPTLLIVTALPGVVVLAILFTIPESPRFLLRKGRREAAAQALSWLSMGKAAADFGSEARQDHQAQAMFSASELFSPQYLMRTMLIWAIWFCWCASYFGLVLFLPLIVIKKGFTPQSAYLYVMGFAAAGIIGRLILAAIIDRIGRRPVLIGCGLASAVAAGALGFADSPITAVAAGLMLGFFQDAGAGAFAVWTPELYPTHARTTGVGFANGSGRVAAIISPALIGILIVDRLDLVFALFAAGYLLTCVAAMMLRVETKGIGLETAALSTDAS